MAFSETNVRAPHPLVHIFVRVGSLLNRMTKTTSRRRVSDRNKLKQILGDWVEKTRTNQVLDPET